MSGLLGRAAAIFFEAAETPPKPSAGTPPPSAGAQALDAAVLGAPAAVVPIAAACAGELRARCRAAAALICVWRPAGAEPPEQAQGEPAARSPAGATTPGAKRLAVRLAAHELGATACGRLAWLALDPDPPAAAAVFCRARALAAAPVVLAIAGPRPAAFEPLLAEFAICVAVLPADIEPALRELALARLPACSHAVVAPLPAGPPRWAAMAGLARMRALPEAPR